MSEKEIILSYKKMALDEKNHLEMMKDKTLVQFLAYSLDHKDIEVVEITLRTLEILVRNPKNYGTLRSVFGVSEALKATAERDDLENSLLNLAKDISSDLESPPTAYCSMSRSTSKPEVTQKKFSSKVYSLHIFGLNEYTRNDLESALIRIRGVISVVLDIEHQRCTVRAVEKITPEAIINHISNKTKLQARLVVKNKLNQEHLSKMLVGPDGNVIYAGERETSGKYTFSAHKTGTYTYCFSNQMSTMTPKVVMFNMEIGEAPANESKDDADHNKMEQMIKELSSALTGVKHEQEYMSVRDRIHHGINEATNSRVVTWSLFEAIVLVTMTIGQVYYLKRFFEVRRVV